MIGSENYLPQKDVSSLISKSGFSQFEIGFSSQTFTYARRFRFSVIARSETTKQSQYLKAEIASLRSQ
jgi:hypothetical protein